MIKHCSKFKNRSLAMPSSSKRTRADRQAGSPHLLAFASLLAASLFISGCSKAPEAEVNPTVTVQVDAAQKEPIQLKVNAEAVLYPHDQAAIIPKVVSPVKKAYVDRGSHVKAGQLLVELESQDLTGQHMKSQGGYQQAEATYQMELQKVEQDSKFAKQSLDGAQKLYDSRVSLFKDGAVSSKDVEDSRLSLAQAQNAYDLAQKRSDLKVAEGQFNAAKGDTANAEAQLSYTKITSPIDGVVTDRPFYPGETAPPGMPVVTVMDLSQIVARAHISVQEASLLKAGDAATISVPGQSTVVKGRVSMVSPALDPNSTTVEVWVAAPNPGERLKPGSSVHVSMVGQTVPDAIVVPVAALLTASDGTTTVITLDTDNVPHKQKVKTGIRDGANVQITDGLQGTERVVIVGAFELDKEDDPVLAKTKIQVQAPKMPDEEE
jgi:HlyD family secretion protein